MERIEQRFTSLTPVVTNGAYSAGDVIGGLLTFTAALSQGTGSGDIRAFYIFDNDKQAKDMKLYLFRSAPATIADNGAFDPSAADLAKIVGILSIATHIAFTTRGISYVDSLAIPVHGTDLSTLYGYLVAGATPPTYTGTGNVTLKLVCIED